MCTMATKIMQREIPKSAKKLRYFDTDQWRQDEMFNTIIEKYQVIEIPCIVVIENGELKKNIQLFDEMNRFRLEDIKQILSFN